MDRPDLSPKEESCLAEYRGGGGRDGCMHCCLQCAKHSCQQDQLNKVLPEFEHTFVFVNNMTKEHLSFQTHGDFHYKVKC